MSSITVILDLQPPQKKPSHDLGSLQNVLALSKYEGWLTTWCGQILERHGDLIALIGQFQHIRVSSGFLSE